MHSKIGLVFEQETIFENTCFLVYSVLEFLQKERVETFVEGLADTEIRIPSMECDGTYAVARAGLRTRRLKVYWYIKAHRAVCSCCQGRAPYEETERNIPRQVRNVHLHVARAGLRTRRLKGRRF
jgi:hypothetical protein